MGKAWPCVYPHPGEKEAVCHGGDEIVVISNSTLICVTERNLFSFSQAEFHTRNNISCIITWAYCAGGL